MRQQQAVTAAVTAAVVVAARRSGANGQENGDRGQGNSAAGHRARRLRHWFRGGRRRRLVESVIGIVLRNFPAAGFTQVSNVKGSLTGTARTAGLARE